MRPCILVYNDRINNRRDAAFLCSLFDGNALHVSSVTRSSSGVRGNCVCSQMSYSIILESVFCLSRAASVQGFVGPGMVCDGCPHTTKRTTIAHHSRNHKTLHRCSTWQTKDRFKNNWIRHLAANTVSLNSWWWASDARNMQSITIK